MSRGIRNAERRLCGLRQGSISYQETYYAKSFRTPDMNINNEELRLLLAIELFEEKKVPLGKASEIAGYTEKAFSEILLKRGISPMRCEDIDLKKEIGNA